MQGDRVLRVGDHGERVVCHLELRVLDAALLAGRDLLVADRLGCVEASVSPAQNFSKPPPVPEVPTVTLTSGSPR